LREWRYSSTLPWPQH